jgi:hypothetical protein
MLKTIPAELATTYQLLQSAFPHGIGEQEYFPLLTILYAQMSDRSLAQVIADYTGREYHAVLNDVYCVGSAVAPTRDENLLNRLQQKLNDSGYAQWLAES